MTSFVFDSAALQPQDSFDAYRDLYAGGSDVSTNGHGFRGWVKASRLGKLVMFERKLNDVAHERSLRRASADGFEHFTLQLNLSGQLQVETPNATRSVAAGDIVLFDTTQAQRTLMTDCHYVTFSVAADLVSTLDTDARNLHGTVLNGGNAFILADLMASLVRRPLQHDMAAAGRVTQMFRQALAMALDTSNTAQPKDPNDAVERVRLLIDAHIADRNLSPEWLSKKANLSRTRLYDLFKSAGGISRHIQKARATKLRQLLARPDMGRFSVGTLCHQVGFASESHAIRTFSDLFAMSPGQYRRQLSETQAAKDSKSAADFDGWIRALTNA